MIGTAATSVVTGTVPTFACGYILARLVSQGATNPATDSYSPLQGLQVVANLDVSGFFEIVAWNNAYGPLIPSITQFTIALRRRSFTVLVLITSANQDISAELSGH